MVPPMDFIWIIYSPQKFGGDSVEEEWKIRWENPQKFIHKLNKQQIERWLNKQKIEWWHLLVNLSQLLLLKSF